VERTGGFANYNQPARADDPSLTGFIGPVGAALSQPIDGAGREAACE
jgi:hypothetical protein